MPDAATPFLGKALTLPSAAHTGAVGRYATRYPDSAWLDLLARRASSGRQDAVTLIRSGPAQITAENAYELCTFAFILAACAQDGSTIRVAAEIFTAAMDSNEAPPLSKRVAGVWLQTLHLSGLLDDTSDPPGEDDVDSQTWWGVQTDRINPFLDHGPSAPARDTTSWLERLSGPFTDQGYQGLALNSDTGAPFDRLTSITPWHVDGPLVSVIVPVYNPPPSLLTSIRSLLEQTWDNIEILLCDDGSETGLHYINASAELDSQRVRVLPDSTNRGTYSAFNRGLACARGRFVTFQGADDYSHPQRIEAHLRTHLAPEAPIGTLSHAIRASGNLALTSVGMRLVPSNASSFMFERAPVLSRLGAYDTVRKAADTEFINRVAATFGAERVRRMENVLAVIQATPDSLSRGELGFLRRHPARQAYRAAADAWHEQIRAGADPYVAPGDRAPFPAPQHISGVRHSPADPTDVVLLTSVTCESPTRSSSVLESLADAGASVTVVEFVGTQDTLIPRPALPDKALARLVAERRARWALPGEKASGSIALVDDPEALLVMPRQSLDFVDSRTLVVVYDEQHAQIISAAEVRLGALGHLKPAWLPASDAAAAQLRSAGTSFQILEPRRWWVSSGTGHPPTTRRNERPIVGTVSARFTPLQAAEVRPRSCIPRDPATPLWSWGPSRSQLLGRPVQRIRPTSMSWQDFIRQVDYFVTPTTAHLNTLVMDAWSEGTVVLATDAMRSLLGDRALYPGPLGADEFIGQRTAESDRDLATAAWEWTTANTSPDALIRTVTAIREQIGL